jgi:DNA-binding PadR family transcriptional regulator
MYALLMMETGPISGSNLTSEIARRTGGRWSPGPGTVYPAFKRLQRQGWIRARLLGGRKLYFITPPGRRELSRYRQSLNRGNRLLFPGQRLYQDFIDTERLPEYLLGQVRRVVRAIEEELASAESILSPEAKLDLQRNLQTELATTISRLGAPKASDGDNLSVPGEPSRPVVPPRTRP